MSARNLELHESRKGRSMNAHDQPPTRLSISSQSAGGVESFYLTIEGITHEQEMRLTSVVTEIVHENQKLAAERKRRVENLHGAGI